MGDAAAESGVPPAEAAPPTAPEEIAPAEKPEEQASGEAVPAATEDGKVADSGAAAAAEVPASEETPKNKDGSEKGSPRSPRTEVTFLFSLLHSFSFHPSICPSFPTSLPLMLLVCMILFKSIMTDRWFYLFIDTHKCNRLRRACDNL
jgi:hypothetical protein